MGSEDMESRGSVLGEKKIQHPLVKHEKDLFMAHVTAQSKTEDGDLQVTRFRPHGALVFLHSVLFYTYQAPLSLDVNQGSVQASDYIFIVCTCSRQRGV